ncbi:transcription antitermination protein NusB [Nonlabens ponticola]|uniref:Transcription antitermination protein NusB n=1 Tax=Nonlabens ponticola TaxID=2496866 RepID=A0A3S9MX66_9FLAO|nr:transcription antitermination protein NusB [Nonlabens ponticola]AZQ43737.1 transcription antitermination protein NusB [Nonlabens ponticola]
MLTRRQLRIKVMQAVFSFHRQRPDDLKDLEKFLNSSMTQTLTLFLYMAQLLVRLHEIAVEKHKAAQSRHLGSQAEKNITSALIDNVVLKQLASSEVLKEALAKRKLKPWDLDSKYVENIYNDIIKSKEYVMYASEPSPSIKKDQTFITNIYTDVIAPSDQLMDYLEDVHITWMDDYPLVNTAMIMFLRKVKPNKEVKLPELVKDTDDIKFAMELFRKTILNHDELAKRVEGKTPNWDKDRIAQIDSVLIMMAQCEFLYFPTIPVKVSLNEYLEISKDYSSPKSSVFINGILDNLLKQFQKNDQINKIGRGTM